VLEFLQGTATFTVGTQIVPYQRTNIFGTTGRIEIEIPFNAPSDCPTRMWIQDGAPAAVKIEEVTFPVCNQYTLQADAFARAVLDDTPVEFPIADAVANMRVIERIFTSAKTNAWA
jgi:predicted dehydrogenase